MRCGTAPERCVPHSAVPTIGTDRSVLSNEGTLNLLRFWSYMYKTVLVVGPLCHLDLKRPTQLRRLQEKNTPCLGSWHTISGEIKEEEKKDKRSEGRLNPSAKVSDRQKVVVIYITRAASPS